MTNKLITVNWVGGSSLPNPVVSPEDLAEAGSQLAERLIAAGFDSAMAYDLWEMWIKSAEKIAIEAIQHSVPSEQIKDYVRITPEEEIE